MRALSATTGALVLSAALVACDELPPGAGAASASAASGTSAEVVDDDALAKRALPFMEAAEAYGQSCEVLVYYGALYVQERCWPKGSCPPEFEANFSGRCGHEPAMPRAVVSHEKALPRDDGARTLSAPARIFLRHAAVFAAFVQESAVEPACKIRESSLCYEGTAGTLARYQGLVEAWNRWRPSERRRLVPVDTYVESGVLRRPIHWLVTGRTPSAEEKARGEKQLAERGLNWRTCADGPCL
jgi:hypothetical protein